ncbi:vWA domain-containing protein [Moraxella oblonga]|uniref:vWA domain-containing protein n=1 Tax=Moraxella oblonga TaxID=200413 RepID=UPI000830E0B5|nr:von Willebrand factor type A domain-containing protein [Moraxella oblonga]
MTAKFTIQTISLCVLTALIGACSSPKTSTQTDDVAEATTSTIAQANDIASAPIINTQAKQMAHYSMHRQAEVAYTPPNHENYQDKTPNPINDTTKNALATFSIDTDTGSYANTRRHLNDGALPPTNAVRIEELINYFNYDFSQAIRQNDAPFLVSTETVSSPWKQTNHIIKIAIKADDPTADKFSKNNELPPANLVFLVDVSGSMDENDKLPLVQASLKMLTKNLREQDTISLITYAGNTEIVLPATSGKETAKIMSAIDHLTASGSTNGEAAIKLAYAQARQAFKKDGINRILMMTDGDFNVGVSDVDDMLEIIRRERDSGVSLSTFGFGQGNLNDHMMEQVADNGNGNYSYIDSLSEAKKALIDEMSATFNTVAKDVKVQVEFNPNTVKEWRLIGYENRVLASEDFNNDKVDAGDLGAGKAVVALFEITPSHQKGMLDDSRYQPKTIDNKKSDELGYLKIRYKSPNGNTSKLIEFPIKNQVTKPSHDLKFAMAVAGFGQLLTQSPYVGDWHFADSKKLAQSGLGKDEQGLRHEFVKLIELADGLTPSK